MQLHAACLSLLKYLLSAGVGRELLATDCVAVAFTEVMLLHTLFKPCRGPSQHRMSQPVTCGHAQIADELGLDRENAVRADAASSAHTRAQNMGGVCSCIWYMTHVR